MNKTVKTIALVGLGALGMAMTGCQKEMPVANEMSTEVGMARQISYTVDGNTRIVTFHDDAEYEAFWDHVFATVHKGSKVSLRGGNGTSGPAYAKEVVTYTTTSKEEARNWAKSMVEQGYTVDISYDEGTGVYTCIATR